MERPPAPTPLSGPNARIDGRLGHSTLHEESEEESMWQKRREREEEERKKNQGGTASTEVLPKQKKKGKRKGKAENQVDTKQNQAEDTGTEVLPKQEEKEKERERNRVDTIGTEVLTKTSQRMKERKERLGIQKRLEGKGVREGGVMSRRATTHHLLKGILAPHPRIERQADTTLKEADTPTHTHPKSKRSPPHKRLSDPPLEDYLMDEVKAQMAVLQQQLAQLQQQQQQQPQQAPPPLPKPIKEYKGGKFEGDRGIQVEDFLYALENQFAMQGVVDSAPKVLIATSGVVGPAAVWVREWRTANPQGTYAQLRQALVSRFEDKTRADRAYTRLMHLKQGEKEAVGDFNKTFSQTVLEVGVRPAEAFLLTCYKNAIKWDLAEHFVDTPPNNLSDAMARTEKREQAREVHKDPVGEKAAA